MKVPKLLPVLLVLVLFLAACANSEDTATDTDDGADTEETTESTAAADDGDDTDGDDAGGDEGDDAAAVEASTPYEHLNRALAGEFDGTEVEILGQWVETEADGFDAALAQLEEASGITINYEGVTDYETVLTVRVDGGNAPDLAQIAQPGLMRTFASEGQIVPVSDWINTDQLNNDYISSFIDLASYEGDIYGVFYKADVKSIVWYPVQAFADAGYEIPETWDDLVALSDQIVADGNGNPWCISVEHSDFSGWVATDWLEDVLLRTADPSVYDQWVNHEIAFDDPEILEAADYVKEIWFTDDYVFGGNTGINSIWVGDTQTPMFDEAGPQCWMHKQAAWIPGFWPKDANEEPLFEPGVDSSFFYFPPIEAEYGSPALGGGDQFVMFNDRPEVRAVLEFLATPEGAKGWIDVGGFLSPNQSTPLDWYTQYPQTDLAAILNEATTFRFDASDTMPAEVGNGTFLTGMVDWVSANGEGTDQVFADIEASWP